MILHVFTYVHKAFVVLVQIQNENFPLLDFMRTISLESHKTSNVSQIFWVRRISTYKAWHSSLHLYAFEIWARMFENHVSWRRKIKYFLKVKTSPWNISRVHKWELWFDKLETKNFRFYLFLRITSIIVFIQICNNF